MNMNYKKFSNKFELPKISEKVPKILGRKFDLETYDRVIYFKHYSYKLIIQMNRNLPFERYGSENTYCSPRIKNSSYNNSNYSSTKDSQLKEKEEFPKKSSDFERSEINSEDY